MGELFRKKIIMVVIITIFVITSVVPSTGSVIKSHSRDLSAYPVFNGTKCDGGWFITPVNTSFYYDNQTVNKIFYRINDEQFFLYENPFIIFKEGNIQFTWYWIYLNGTISDIFSEDFRVDYTPPNSSIISPKEGGFYLFSKMLFQKTGVVTITIGRTTIIAEAVDEYSGVARVLFSLSKNNEKPESHEVYTEPFIWNLKGIHMGNYILNITAYDLGGLSSAKIINLKIFDFGFISK